jgi:hypothetical protein
MSHFKDLKLGSSTFFQSILSIVVIDPPTAINALHTTVSDYLKRDDRPGGTLMGIMCLVGAVQGSR